MVAAAALALLSPGCYRLTQDERKLIGTWEYETIDAVGRVEFHRNHTWELSFADDPAAAHPKFRVADGGAWHLNGKDLVSASDLGRVMTVRIIDLREDEILYSIDTAGPHVADARFKRVK